MAVYRCVKCHAQCHKSKGGWLGGGQWHCPNHGPTKVYRTEK